MRKVLAIMLITIFLTSSIPPTYAASLMPDFLCEIGLQFYRQGRYEEALGEFKKALMVQPNYEPALKYIQMIEQMGLAPEEQKEIIPVTFRPTSTTRAGAIKEVLDLIEIQREMIQERQLAQPQVISPLPGEKKAITPPKILTLDESLSKISQPIEVEQGKSIIVVGKNIQRFLITQPDIIVVEKKSPDELLITAKGIGYTYLHIWDENGRWTTEWLVVFPKPEGPTYEELMRKEEQKARNFKLSYSLGWASYETGRRIKTLERTSYSWSHDLGLIGPTPYGNFDSSATVSRVPTSTDLTYFTLGLTDGQLGQFKGFSLRGFDYVVPFSNMAFPGATLRGAILTSPVFDNKLNYATFWGREGGGRYGNLSPSLTKIKNSFLDGVNLNYSPTKIQNYKFTAVHGWGRDRANYLNRYSYDFMNNWNFDKWALGYEVAHDSETFGYLANTRFNQPKLNLAAEFRNVSNNFLSITGSGWRQGELGGLVNLNYTPTDKLGINSSLDVYQDRLYPAQDKENRLNEDFNCDTTYQIDPKTSLRLNYTLQNDLGRISQYRYQSAGFGLSKTFKLIRDISTYFNYYHQESKNFSSPSSDYINDRFYAGMRFNLIGSLYYYINKEMNLVQERYYADRSRPYASETGVDWSRQIGKTPLYGSFRFTYRDEEDTVSNLSFLSGEDYIEGYAELSYRPTANTEIYGSCRSRNVWSDNPSVSKRFEMSFNSGMRYVWDTGVRWESVGNIEGYVFKDLNSDGLREKDEAPVEGIKIWLGKNKSTVTDIFGYYRFKGVKARKAYVTLDSSTLPPGFVLTMPVIQEVDIKHHRTARIDFGIICHSEISGLVFEDVDGNGEYSKDDLGVAGVVITLEDGTKAITSATGGYSFSHPPVGEHTITLDLNSLPVYYLPSVALTKKITLFEGSTYIHNIPLKRVKE